MRYKFYILLTALAFFSCAELNTILNQMSVQKPTVDITNAKIFNLSFDDLDLLFDIQINNPNTVGINLAGFDYELLINDNSFISGNQPDKLEIAAQNSNTIQLPVNLKFVDIYNTFANLKKNDNSKYQIKCGLNFDLPVFIRENNGAVRGIRKNFFDLLFQEPGGKQLGIKIDGNKYLKRGNRGGMVFDMINNLIKELFSPGVIEEDGQSVGNFIKIVFPVDIATALFVKINDIIENKPVVVKHILPVKGDDMGTTVVVDMGSVFFACEG